MTSFLGLIASLLFLLVIRQTFTQNLFEVLRRLIRNMRLLGLIYGFLFLPGVLLHEGSHWLVAKLLRVRTHRISLIPTWTEGGALRFGYVEMEKPDHLRASLVGAAPLLLGTVVVLIIGLEILGLDSIFQSLMGGNLKEAGDALKIVLEIPDVWLWLYLLITVSNMMLPSASDRASWIPVGVILVLLLILVSLIAPEATQVEWVNGLIEGAIESVATAFGITAAIDMLLVMPLWGVRTVIDSHPR